MHPSPWVALSLMCHSSSGKTPTRETLSEAPPYNQLRSLYPHSRKRAEAGTAPTTQTPLTTHQDSLAALSKFTSWLESIVTRMANMPCNLREPTNKLVNNKKMLELYFPELSQSQTKSVLVCLLVIHTGGWKSSSNE